MQDDNYHGGKSRSTEILVDLYLQEIKRGKQNDSRTKTNNSRGNAEAPSRQSLSEGFRDSEEPEDLEGFRRESTRGARLLPEELFEAGRYADLPFQVFIHLAAQRGQEESDSKEQDYQYQSRTWGFVRYCKAHPKLTQLSADEAFKKIPWQCTPFGEDEQLSFLVEWNRVNFIPGVTPLDWALNMARHKTLVPPEPHSKLKTYALFLSIAGWLQVLLGNNAIFLPCRRVAEMMGVSRETVLTMRQLAIQDGLLEIVERHTSTRATRFRFAVERYPVLRKPWI